MSSIPEPLPPGVVLCALCFQPIKLEVRENPGPGERLSGWQHVHPGDANRPLRHAARPGGVR